MTLMDPDEVLLRRNVQRCERILGKTHEDTLDALHHLAVFLDNRGDDEEALTLYRRTLEGRRMVLGPDHPHVMDCLLNLGILLDELGEASEAEALLSECHTSCVRVLGINHRGTMECWWRLAVILEKGGFLIRACEMCQHHLECLENDPDMGIDHPDALRAIAQLAAFLETRGEQCYPEAEGICRTALERHKRMLGLYEPTGALTYSLCLMLSRTNRCQEAEQLLQQHLKESEEKHGKEADVTMGYVEDYATLLLESFPDDRRRDAYKLFSRVVDWKMRTCGDRHEDYLRSMLDMAACTEGDEAVELYRAVIRVRSATLGDDHPHTLEDRYDLAMYLFEKCMTDDAIGEFNPLMQVLESKLEGIDEKDADPQLLLQLVICATKLGELLRAQGNLDEAEGLFRRVYGQCTNRLEANPGDELLSQELADASYNLALCLMQRDQLEEAIQFFKVASERSTGACVEGDQRLMQLKAQFLMAMCLNERDEYPAALKIFKVVAHERSIILGPMHKETLAAEEMVEEVMKRVQLDL